MEIDHIVSIVDLDEHGNPRFTCSVKPDYRDQWVTTPREPLRCANATETNGDRISQEWAKFMKTVTPEVQNCEP